MVDASGNTEITPILIHLQLNKKINKIGKGSQIIFDNLTSDFFPPSGISRCSECSLFRGFSGRWHFQEWGFILPWQGRQFGLPLSVILMYPSSSPSLSFPE
jgi:hypothetical protein